MSNSYERKREHIRLGRLTKGMGEERGYSQQHLADAIQVNRTTISRSEHGEYDLGMSHVPALARALGLDLDTFCHLMATFESTIVARCLAPHRTGANQPNSNAADGPDKDGRFDPRTVLPPVEKIRSTEEPNLESAVDQHLWRSDLGVMRNLRNCA